jgi:hypothetical protein
MWPGADPGVAATQGAGNSVVDGGTAPLRAWQPRLSWNLWQMRKIVVLIDGSLRVSFVLVWSAALMFAAGLAVLFHRLADCWIARRVWAPVIFKALRSTVEVDGERLDPAKNYVFVMNHQSSLDIPAAYLATSHPFRFMAKKE